MAHALKHACLPTGPCPLICYVSGPSLHFELSVHRAIQYLKYPIDTKRRAPFYTLSTATFHAHYMYHVYTQLIEYITYIMIYATGYRYYILTRITHLVTHTTSICCLKYTHDIFHHLSSHVLSDCTDIKAVESHRGHQTNELIQANCLLGPWASTQCRSYITPMRFCELALCLAFLQDRLLRRVHVHVCRYVDKLAFPMASG